MATYWQQIALGLSAYAAHAYQMLAKKTYIRASDEFFGVRMLRQFTGDPAARAVLADVLETVITYRKLEGREAHEECARELMAFYHSGVEERGELLSCMGVTN